MSYFKTLFMLLAVLFVISSCEDDNKTTQSDDSSSQNLTGKWELVISKKSGDPINEIDKVNEQIIDTIVNDSYQEEVFLYRHSDNSVTGNAGMFKLFGKIENKTLTLNVYEPNDGEYNSQEAIGSMIKISSFTATMTNNYEFAGSGAYLNVERMSQVGMANDEYFIFGRKVDDMSKIGSNEPKSLTGDLCNIAGSVLSFAIGWCSDNTVRPMGGCGLHKDGGGYYIFGHEGPGSLIPVWTQTVYYPYEWSACGTRTYGFDISLKGTQFTVGQVLQFMGGISYWAKLTGHNDIALLTNEINELHNVTGGFAIAGAKSQYSGNMSLYILTEKGSYNQVVNVPLIAKFITYFNGLPGSLDVFVGNSIHDTFKLRRSSAFVCNTPVIFFYLFGTNNCNFD